MSLDSGHSNLLETVGEYHRNIEAIFARLEHLRTDGDVDERLGLAEKVTSDVLRHNLVESGYLYPLAQRVLYDGDEIVTQARAQHNAVEELIGDLAMTDPEQSNFPVLLTRLIANLRGHIEGHEDQLLPRLRLLCTAEELRALDQTLHEV